MEYVKRELEDDLWKYMEAPEILAVVGPRQAGKTTLLKRIYDGLENSNFVTFEDREILNLFEEDEKDFAKIHFEDFDYLLIDEFQYAQQGGKKLKYLYDIYPDKKILITGSSTAEMTVKGLKYLTGRVLKFRLSPFSFREFLRYKESKLFDVYQEKERDMISWIKNKGNLTIAETIIDRLEQLRKEYCIYGGYPRVVLSDSEKEKQKILKNIVDTYLVKEIGEVLRISEDREIENLMKVLAVQMGDKVNYNSIMDKVDTNYHKLKKRLNILEHTFVLKQVRPFFRNKQKEVVKAPKIFFYDNGFRNSLINSFQDMELRKDQRELNENFFFSQAREELKYWRTKSKAEVDFILDKEGPIPFEIKTTPKTTKSFLSFKEKYKPEKSFIMNEKKLEKKRDVLFVPLPFSQTVVRRSNL